MVPADHFALGGCLLHLLPEDRFDRQPLWAPDRSCCLVADVRLDNRADLTRDLNLTQPDSLADSAILLEAWLRWGSACLDHIVGGFAFAVWTPARHEVFAARDHTGERPLLYHHTQDSLTVASMPAGLRAVGLATDPDELRIADWMALTNPDQSASFYAGVARLPKGPTLCVLRPTHLRFGRTGIRVTRSPSAIAATATTRKPSSMCWIERLWRGCAASARSALN